MVMNAASSAASAAGAAAAMLAILIGYGVGAPLATAPAGQLLALDTATGAFYVRLTSGDWQQISGGGTSGGTSGGGTSTATGLIMDESIPGNFWLN